MKNPGSVTVRVGVRGAELLRRPMLASDDVEPVDKLVHLVARAIRQACQKRLALLFPGAHLAIGRAVPNHVTPAGIVGRVHPPAVFLALRGTRYAELHLLTRPIVALGARRRVTNQHEHDVLLRFG